VDNRYSLVLIDIDNFKNINDTKGHMFGDQVLKRLAQILQATVGCDGKVYRIAGDEFICIVPQQKVSQICSTIRDNVRKEDCFTISQGIVDMQEGQVIHESINQADYALYQSKIRGKDSIFFANRDPAQAN
jgi:diguanylate cyclase (GGDEF)-like protein